MMKYMVDSVFKKILLFRGRKNYKLLNFFFIDFYNEIYVLIKCNFNARIETFPFHMQSHVRSSVLVHLQNGNEVYLE